MLQRYRYSIYILLIFTTLLSGCFEDNMKPALKQSLQELVLAVEQKKQLTVTNKLTSGFRGNARYNQHTMSELIFQYYPKHKFIKIYTLVNAIEIKTIASNPHAKMQFHLVLTSTKSTLPEHMRVFKIESRWLRLNKEWKMTEASWIEVRPQTVYPKIKKLIESLKTVTQAK